MADAIVTVVEVLMRSQEMATKRLVLDRQVCQQSHSIPRDFEQEVRSGSYALGQFSQRVPLTASADVERASVGQVQELPAAAMVVPIVNLAIRMKRAALDLQSYWPT